MVVRTSVEYTEIVIFIESVSLVFVLVITDSKPTPPKGTLT